MKTNFITQIAENRYQAWQQEQAWKKEIFTSSSILPALVPLDFCLENLTSVRAGITIKNWVINDFYVTIHYYPEWYKNKKTCHFKSLHLTSEYSKSANFFNILPKKEVKKIYEHLRKRINKQINGWDIKPKNDTILTLHFKEKLILSDFQIWMYPDDEFHADHVKIKKMKVWVRKSVAILATLSNEDQKRVLEAFPFEKEIELYMEEPLHILEFRSDAEKCTPFLADGNPDWETIFQLTDEWSTAVKADFIKKRKENIDAFYQRERR